MEAAFVNYRQEGLNTTIMMFDMDNFKVINDEYGHEFGDYTLVQTVYSIQKNIRSTDRLIRWGGDEFVGIFYNLTEDSIAVLGQKILDDVMAMRLEKDNVMITPAISIGFSYFKDSDYSYEDALGRADLAMYKSKKQGKSTFNLYK